ncbi:unnamed protein product [Staurois parvus]|uniref:Uncharacterized protein n=1 Tax=Staurois parvus TaxID=386267 RepID=A0ABN9BY87_9NEOB|nr:unnamed protein product [Staurois parvus]
MGPHVPPLHAAARPVICHGPLYRLLMLLPGPEVCHGSLLRTLHCCCLQKIATLCHVPLSGLLTLLVVSIFCPRVLYGLPILCCCCQVPPPHCGSHTLVLAP